MSEARRLKALEGENAKLKKLRRLYCEEKPGGPQGRPEARSRDTKVNVGAGSQNVRWSLDVVSDALADGRRFRVLAVVADTSPVLSGLRVVRELDVLIGRRGRPAMVVSDNGTELTSTAVLSWCQRTGVDWHFIAPGKPMRDTGSSRVSTDDCGTSS